MPENHREPVATGPKGKKKEKKGEIEVDFQYVVPNGAYYHTIKALLNQFIDAPDQNNVDLTSLADHICERTSIGQVVGGPLDADKDPELMPEFQSLSDEEFTKRSARFYAERDVFAFSSILSLNWSSLQGLKQPAFLQAISSYTVAKAEEHCNWEYS